MIKSKELIRLEDAGILMQSTTTGCWYSAHHDWVDLTPYLLAAGYFEQ